MKKIGILTFHRSINYGSILQAWALEQFLLDAKYNVEIIDYEPQEYKSIYGLFDSAKSKVILRENIKRLLYLDLLLIQKQQFNKFRNSNLVQSQKKFFFNSDLEEMAKKYDCIICGSDQIWNVRARDCDPAYFLPIKHTCKKIAYAASINSMDFTEEYDFNQMKKWLEDFDLISVRESSGAEKLQRFLNRKNLIYTAIDPTLLHNKEKYNSICSERIIPEKYIFLYTITYHKDTIKKALEMGKKFKIPVYTIATTRNASILLDLRRKGIKIIRKKSSPSDFLSYIKHAELVVTNSFHGTAFSVNYEKSFIAVNDRQKDNSYMEDERILNLLNKLELTDRYVHGDEKGGDLEEIQYANIHCKKEKLINASKKMLLRILEED